MRENSLFYSAFLNILILYYNTLVFYFFLSSFLNSVYFFLHSCRIPKIWLISNSEEIFGFFFISQEHFYSRLILQCLYYLSEYWPNYIFFSVQYVQNYVVSSNKRKIKIGKYVLFTHLFVSLFIVRFFYVYYFDSDGNVETFVVYY